MFFCNFLMLSKIQGCLRKLLMHHCLYFNWNGCRKCIHTFLLILFQRDIPQNNENFWCWRPFTIIDGKLYKQGQDQILCQCLHDDDISVILWERHEGVGGIHFSMDITTQKVLDAKYWWPTLHKDAQYHCHSCDIANKLEISYIPQWQSWSPCSQLNHSWNGI